MAQDNVDLFSSNNLYNLLAVNGMEQVGSEGLKEGEKVGADQVTQKAGTVGPLMQDTIAQSQEEGIQYNPEAALPMLQTPQLSQSLISNNEMIASLLNGNKQVNGNFEASGSIEALYSNSKLMGMNPMMLQILSQDAYKSFVTANAAFDLNKTINDAITYSWKKFNEVLQQIKDEEEKYLRSGGKAYLDYINSSQYLSKQADIHTPHDQKFKINKSVMQFEAFLKSLPAGDRDRLLQSIASETAIDKAIMGTRLSSALEVFGTAYEQASAANPARSASDAAMMAGVIAAGVGGIVTFPFASDYASTNQVAVNVIQNNMVDVNQAAPIHGFNDNEAAMLGYLGGLLAQGMATQAAYNLAIEAKAVGKNPKDIPDTRFAMRYAHTIKQFVYSEQFEQALSNFLSHRMGNNAELEKIFPDVLKRVRILMLSNALGVLYEAKMQTPIDGQTWKDAVKRPETMENLPDIGDYAKALALEIQYNLPSNATQESALLNSMRIYFDTNRANSELLEINQSLKDSLADFVPQVSLQA